MQLVAYGAQDIYLTGNPQITFFKVVYRKHTNFSMESIKQTFSGTAHFGNEVVATISRNGDLVGKMYLEHVVKLVAASAAAHQYINICPNYGSNLIKECEIEIGGQSIDKHYSHWHSVYSQLTEFNPSGAQSNGYDLVDVDSHQGAFTTFGGLEEGSAVKSTLFNTMSGNGGPVSTGLNAGPGEAGMRTMGSWTINAQAGAIADVASATIFIPLYFWFCRSPGLALPLIALQYHEVKVKMTFDDKINLFNNTVEGDSNNVMNAPFTDANDTVGDAQSVVVPGLTNHTVSDINDGLITQDFNLWCDYIYLDTEERRRFAQVSHEYLIEQVQFQSFDNRGTLDLNFNHPVKELIWTRTPSSIFTAPGDDLGIGPARRELLLKRLPETMSGNFQLKLNGHDRFQERVTKYFTRTQVWQHHTGYGSTINSDAIAVYSFALKPEEHQPSGTCNFSRIDSAQLTATNAAAYNVYAVNYNVLRIMSGMGGLAYSN